MGSYYLIKDDMLEAYYKTLCDFNEGIIDDHVMKDRLFQIALRYERHIEIPPLEPRLSETR